MSLALFHLVAPVPRWTLLFHSQRALPAQPPKHVNPHIWRPRGGANGPTALTTALAVRSIGVAPCAAATGGGECRRSPGQRRRSFGRVRPRVAGGRARTRRRGAAPPHGRGPPARPPSTPTPVRRGAVGFRAHARRHGQHRCCCPPAAAAARLGGPRRARRRACQAAAAAAGGVCRAGPARGQGRDCGCRSAPPPAASGPLARAAARRRGNYSIRTTPAVAGAAGVGGGSQDSRRRRPPPRRRGAAVGGARVKTRARPRRAAAAGTVRRWRQRRRRRRERCSDGLARAAASTVARWSGWRRLIFAAARQRWRFPTCA